MSKRRIRWAVTIAALALLGGLLVFGVGAVSRWLFFQGFTADTAVLVKHDILCRSACRTVEFTFDSRDIKFYNDLKWSPLEHQDAMRQVRVAIDGKGHWVELSFFRETIGEWRWPEGKPPVTITFPSHHYLDRVRQYHLLPIDSIDWFGQQLIYRLAEAAGLAVPKTAVARVAINDVFEDNVLMKQALDNLFLERLASPGAVIFKLRKQNAGPPSIRYIYNEHPDPGLHRHIIRFAAEAEGLNGEEAEKLAETYLDLDYLAGLEALRQVLGGQPQFMLAGNLTFIYNSSSGKIYPLVDENNLRNLIAPPAGTEDFLHRLALQVTAMPRLQEQARLKQNRLSSDAQAFQDHFKRTKAIFQDFSGKPVHRLKTWITATFFQRHVYRRLQQGRDTQETGPEPPADIAKTPLPPLHPPIVEEGNQWIIPNGVYTLSRNLRIPAGVLLVVEAGVTLRLAPDVSIISKSPVEIRGTEQEPVVIEALTPSKPFGVVAISGPSEQPSRIRHLRFSGSGEAFADGVMYSAGLTVSYNDVEMSHSVFSNIQSDTQLAVKHSYIRLEGNTFNLQEDDCLILEFCKAVISGNRFDGQASGRNADAVSTDHCQLIIENSIIENFSDKGLNLGKRSLCLAADNDIRRNGIGIAVKDRARLLAWNNRLAFNNKTIALYRQTPNFGGGSVYLLANQWRENHSGIEADTGSQLFRLDDTQSLPPDIAPVLKNRDPDGLSDIFTTAMRRYRYRPNRLRSLTIGDCSATIDRENRLIIVNLPADADPVQPIAFTSDISGSTLRIYPFTTGPSGHFPGPGEPPAISSGADYDFKEFIFYGQVALEWRWQSEYFEIFVTRGATFTPIMLIDTRNRAGNPRPIKNEPKIPCRVRVLGLEPDYDTDYMGRTLEARIEGRGQKWPKWKYGFNLESAASLLGLNRSRKWVLESSFVEKSLMRPKLAFDLFRSFAGSGEPNNPAPRGRFTELYLDGHYQGLYLLLEHIDDDFLDLESFDKNEDHNALLYRAYNLNADFTAINSEPEVGPLFRHFPDSRQLADKNRDPIFGWHSGFVQRHPEPERFGDYYQPLEEFVRFAALSTDSRFQREIFTRLDMARYVDLWIFTQLLDDRDGLFQNRYFARHRGAGKTWFFVPWDKDGVMGRGFDMARRPHDQWLVTPLFQRCFQIPVFRTALARRWFQLRRQGIITPQSLERAIDDTVQLIASAQQRNFAKWPPDMPQYPDTATFSSEIEYMKEWLRRRIQWLDIRFGSLAPEVAQAQEENK